MLYTYGGTPADVLTTATGDVVPDYALTVRVAGTGAVVTAMYEADGTTPISQLRTNPTGADTPGAIRTFKVDGVTAIEYEYNGPSGSPVRWYEAGREVAQQALDQVSGKLDVAGGTVTGDLVVDGSLSAESGLDASSLDVSGDGAVDGNLTVGGTFEAAGLSLAGMRIYNPRLYGATGDGTGNDAPAIQAALTAAYNAGGGWVIVPSGTYLIGATLRIYRNTRLTLMPGAELRRNVAGTMLLNGDPDQTYGGYTGHGNILIEGGLWNMRGTTAGLTASAMCISIGHAQGVIVRDLEVRDLPGYHGVELNSTKNGLVANCVFRGYVDPGGRDFSEAIQVDLAKSSAEFGGFGPYDHTPCEDIEVRGCYVGASGTAGTTAWPRGVGSHAATITKWHRRIRVIGNSFEGLTEYAIVAYNWSDVVIDGNTISGCGSGIRCRTVIVTDTEDTKLPDGTQTSASQPMENLTITGNTVVDTGSYDDAILLYGETTGHIVGATVTGNVVDTVGGVENGIRAFNADQYTVSGNTLRGVAGTAISQQAVTGATVTGNRVYQPGSSGISCDTGTGVLIGANTVREAGVNGIHVLSGSDVQVQDNYIKGASRAASGSYGIRVSSGTDGVMVTGNRIRRYGSGNEAAYGLSITSTCTGVRRYGNDLMDSGTSGPLDDQSTSSETSPLDASGVLEEVMRPAGRYETTSRLRCGTTSTTYSSGTLYLVPIWLPKGLVVSNISFASGATAASSPTNWWFSLHDLNRVALARTADQLTASWAANTVKTLPIAQATAGTASSYTTTYRGLHYLGVMVAAATVPGLVGEGSVTAVTGTSPGLGATSTGQTSPPTVTAAAFTAAAFTGGSAPLAYGYVT